MVYVRQTIVADASCALSRAVCIATRYSAVRRQFGSQNGGPETQVINKSLYMKLILFYVPCCPCSPGILNIASTCRLIFGGIITSSNQSNLVISLQRNEIA